MRPLHLAALVVLMAVWGFSFVVMAIALKTLPPLALCVVRFFLAAFPAVFFLRKPEVPFRHVLLYGLFTFAVHYGLVVSGMNQGLATGLTSLVIQVHVFFTILFAVLFLKERASIWHLVGSIVSFSGIGVIAWHRGGNVTLTGLLLVIAAAASWGTGNLLSKVIGKVDMLPLVAWGSLVSWPPLMIFSLLIEGPGRIAHGIASATMGTAGAILYLVYPSTLLGFATWSWFFNRYSAATIAPFTLLVPVFGLISSTMVLGEPLEIWKILALVLVVAGLVINLAENRFSVKKQFALSTNLI